MHTSRYKSRSFCGWSRETDRGGAKRPGEPWKDIQIFMGSVKASEGLKQRVNELLHTFKMDFFFFKL